MTEKEINTLKELYRKVLSPEVAKLMCDKLDKMLESKGE